jgi:hypothetical protein
MDLKAVGTKRKIQIAELEEWRKKAYQSAKLYKERTKRWHDKRVKTNQFKSGDKISCLTLSKESLMSVVL